MNSISIPPNNIFLIETKKIQIIREVKDRNGEYAFAKLGRLAKEEAEGILPLIQEALKAM